MKNLLPMFSAAVFSAVLIAACGGGGADGPEFGLKAKPVLRDLHFPAIADVGTGDIRVVKAFPNLSFSSPLVFAQAPGDSTRAFVATQGGVIYVFENSATVTSTKIFLDLSDRTKSEGEMGLLGLAFDPDYATNGYLYVYYSANFSVTLGDSVIARYKVSTDPDVADRSSETKLLQFAQPFTNHNGGALAFGPDKMLYIASGDGGSGGDPQGNGQKLTTPLGKILRIKTDGSIPADNPFVGTAGARGEIWAYGLRNPFRFTFDRSTGQLWAGDVGQGEYEEIDVVTKGGNYGWSTREGLHGYPTASTPKPSGNNFIDPIFEYSHSGGACSITGGVVYRGSAIAKLAGKYVYSDFCSGTLWALSHDSGTVATGNATIGAVPNPSGFGEDHAGEIYITSFDGNVYKIEVNPGSSIVFPQKLSETGLFTNVASLTPNPSLIEYEINAPFYSDGARKRRWFGVPAGGVIHFSANESFDLPLGGVTMKHFEITNEDGSTRRLETRVFLHQTDGWHGYTYKWNLAGTDADLINDAQTESITVRTDGGAVRTQTYEYPSRVACVTCHNSAAGATLGLRAGQLNKIFDFSGVMDNQLRAYSHVALLDVTISDPADYGSQTDPSNPSAALPARARSYLAVNCSQCHRPGGPTGVNMDLRLDTAIGSTNTINVLPTTGDLGDANNRRIRPGNKEQSVLWERMRRLDNNRMPPIASHVVDEAGVTLIGQWIDAGAN